MPSSLKVELHKVRGAGADPLPQVVKEVATAPEDSVFAAAARWKIEVPPAESGRAISWFLQIDYEGDVARLYVDGKLFDDNFYNGRPWFIGINRIPAQEWGKLELKILPLREHAPIYLPSGAWPALGPGGEVARVKSLVAVPQYELIIVMGLDR